MSAPKLPVVAEPVWRELHRFVRFGPEDAALLCEFREVARPHFAGLAEAFYERVREHADAHRVLRDEAQVERLKQLLRGWLERVLTGPHDAAYYEKTAEIGRVHVRVGVPARYTSGAMTLVRIELTRLAVEAGQDRVSPLAVAIDKVLDVELAVMLDAHFADDMARLRRYEESLREEVKARYARTAAQWSDAVELARIVFVGLDADGSIQLFNCEAEATTGYARDEALGQPFVDWLVPEEHQPEVRAAIAAARAGERPLLDGSAIRTRSGRLREVRWQFAGHEGADDPVALFAIGQDTTGETAILAKVRQAERLTAIGTLAAGLAHEIRNPLNGAQLHLTFLERGLRRAEVTDDDTMEAVATVRSEIQRLSELVTEFLEFARPRPLDLAWSDLRASCERAARAVEAEARAAGCEIVLDLTAAAVELGFDAGKIEQALAGLLRNAVESLAPVGGPITLRLRREPREAVIEVEDAGAGIEQAATPVFDPFYSTKPEGTGLGLSIVHRIVTDHGGAVSFRSRKGQTVFRVELPIELSPDSKQPRKGAGN